MMRDHPRELMLHNNVQGSSAQVAEAAPTALRRRSEWSGTWL